MFWNVKRGEHRPAKISEADNRSKDFLEKIYGEQRATGRVLYGSLQKKFQQRFCRLVCLGQHGIYSLDEDV